MERTAIDLEMCLREVQTALSTVCDPELDESVTELGFVREILITKDGDVSVSFRLPTYWCSANFAYLMASDMRDAVALLPWAGRIDLRLIDHFTSAEVTAGASAGKSFKETFPSEAEDDLENIRLIFRRKSFQKRQETLLRHLLGRGETIPDLVSMSLAALMYRSRDSESAAFRERYLQARMLLGFDHSSSTPVFHDVEGKALKTAEFAGYLFALRRVRLNTEFNGAICRGLLEVRYGVKHNDGLVQIDGIVAREAVTVFQSNRQAAQLPSFTRHRT
jgi:metal-sulfur cluster biosynthetic enzyme